MDGSKEHPLMTAGLDLGDKHSYFCTSSINAAARLWTRTGCLPPRSRQATLRFGAAAVHRHRGWNPLPLGKEGTRGVRPQDLDGKSSQSAAHLRQSKRKMDALRTWLD